jgi:hypothetical protein
VAGDDPNDQGSDMEMSVYVTTSCVGEAREQTSNAKPFLE